MKNSLLFYFYVLFYASTLYATTDTFDDSVHIAVAAKSHEKMHIFLSSVGSLTDELKEIVHIIASDFQMTEQCTVKTQHIDVVQKKSEIKKLYEQNYYLAIFISQEKNGFSWRLYDTQQATMVVGKKYEKRGLVLRGWAHNLSDQIWPEFMGAQSCFSSKIAYCKQLWVKHNGRDRVYKHIYIADADGKNVRPLVEIPTVCLAPRWSNQVNDPILFYSENTLSNVRLVMANMYGKRRTICSFDGLNMLPAFADDHKNIVFCLSKDGSSQLYHSFLDGQHKRVFNRMTQNNADNFSPCYIDDHTIAFVSDYQAKYPSIYSLDIKTLKTTPITTDGYCACPAYCKANNKLLYSKMMGQAMQIFTYDIGTKTHEQLTKGHESKEEGCWSPCGNFIIFAARSHGQSRIARYNLLTGKMHYITPASENCTYPAWSPVHTIFVN
ncbi:PD40 domain-containing protein [Candidatus Babeliales bacterium]|nr:PD40 domain-containing protein [Candidatus Babeliales bacterium]MBP9844325.1 PD40 domain-containing protein [Candidatus Babeliales bacterium]